MPGVAQQAIGPSMRVMFPHRLCRNAIAETLWGRRGVVKANHIWLALAALVSTATSGNLVSASKLSLCVFGAAACYSQAAILANDLSDRQRDIAAGKSRWIFSLPPAAGAAIVILFLAAGAIFLLPAGDSPLVLLTYLAGAALGLTYSLPPLPLKERGLFGLAAYSAASLVVYAVLPWLCFRSEWRMLAVISAAVFLDKWVNLHFHQVIDFSADEQAGTKTFTIVAGSLRSRRLLRMTAWFAALWLALALVHVIFLQPSWRPAIVAAVAAALALVLLRIGVTRQFAGSGVSPLIRELPAVYLALAFVLFRFLPLAILGRMALLNQTIWPVLGLFLVLMLIESAQLLRYRYE